MHRSFDLYEQVKLIETYMKIKDIPRATWTTYIKQLSTTFREYAKSRKIVIDENYRSVRGITLQIQYLDYRFTQGKSGMKNNILWMKNIFSFYREERAKFDELLAEANRLFAPNKIESLPDKSNAELDIYEMSKLVELCSRKYDTQELLELSKFMQDYASSEDFRTVYDLNRRISRIVRLLNGYEEKAGTLPIEREIVLLFKENRTEFDNIVAKANELLNISPKEKSNTEDSEIKIRCFSLLNEFQGGISLNSPIDTDRFCAQYKEIYKDMPFGGENELLKTLQEIGDFRDGKVYPPASEAKKELIFAIYAEIKKIFSEGYSCVYIESILEKYRDTLGKNAVYSVKELKSILLSTLEEKYEINRDRIIARGKNANIGEDALLYLKNCGEPKTLSDIYHNMWYIPSKRIMEGIHSRKDIINIAIKTYMAVDIFPINTEYIDKIRAVIKNALQNSANGKLKDEECRQIVEKEFPDLAIDTENYTTKAFFGSLGYFLNDDPTFEGKYVILSRDDIQSIADMFREFCYNRERFTFDELAEFAKENNTTLSYYYGVIREKVIRLNKNEFCLEKFINFDIDAIDAKLELFCPEEYAPLKTVRNFQLLPMVENIPWNYFLLESYVNNISKKFKLMHLEFLKTAVAGVMVRRDASFSDYDDLLIDALSKANWTTEEDALSFLAREGYLASNQYAKISVICKKAQEMKEVS